MPAAEPQDHRKKAEPFEWKMDDGHVVTLTPFKRLPAGVLETIDELSEIKANFVMLAEATNEDDMAAIRRMPLEDMEDMLQGWMKASGVDLPES